LCAPTDFQYLFIEDGIRYPGNKSTRTFNCTAYSLLKEANMKKEKPSLSAAGHRTHQAQYAGYAYRGGCG
jgi:hypothetical protein